MQGGSSSTLLNYIEVKINSFKNSILNNCVEEEKEIARLINHLVFCRCTIRGGAIYVISIFRWPGKLCTKYIIVVPDTYNYRCVHPATAGLGKLKVHTIV